MRLIDADAFDKMLIEAQAKCKKNGGNFRFGVLDNIRANLALFPTVDRLAVIRCKDCKYWAAERINDFNKCRRWINVGVKNFATMGDWYCADGEQKPTQNNAKNNALDVR